MNLLTAKIPKGHISILAQVFYGMEGLSRQDSRKRTRFVKWLNKQSKEFQADQLELIEEFGERDPETNELITSDSNGALEYKIPKANQEEYKAALTELREEEVTFGELSTQDLVADIARISYNCQQPYSGGEAEVLDTFMDNFDELYDGFDQSNPEG